MKESERVHTIRTRDYGKTKRVVDVPRYGKAKAIKVFCSECLGHEDHPKECSAKMCPLFPFRGKSQAAYAEGRPLKDGERTGYAY